jgi:hypothetical protein
LLSSSFRQMRCVESTLQARGTVPFDEDRRISHAPAREHWTRIGLRASRNRQDAREKPQGCADCALRYRGFAETWGKSRRAPRTPPCATRIRQALQASWHALQVSCGVCCGGVRRAGGRCGSGGGG